MTAGPRTSLKEAMVSSLTNSVSFPLRYILFKLSVSLNVPSLALSLISYRCPSPGKSLNLATSNPLLSTDIDSAISLADIPRLFAFSRSISRIS